MTARQIETYIDQLLLGNNREEVLEKLFNSISPKSSVRIIEYGGVPILVNCLLKGDNKERELAVVILHDVITRNDHNHSIDMIIHEGLPTLLHMLASTSISEKEAAAGLLRNIVVRGDNVLKVIVDHSSVKLLIHLLENESHFRLLEDVVVIMSQYLRFNTNNTNNSHNSNNNNNNNNNNNHNDAPNPNIQCVVTEGGIQALAKHLGSEPLTRATQRALSRFSNVSFPEGVINVPLLLDLITPETVIFVIRILGQMALGSDQLVLDIVAAGGIKKMLQIITTGTNKEQDNAAATMANITLHKNSHEEIINEGGIATILQILVTNTGSLQREAAKILANMSSKEESGDEIAIRGGIKVLVRLLSIDNTELRGMILSILENLSHHYNNNIMLIAQEEGVKPLLRILETAQSESEKSKVIGIMSCLVEDEGIRNEIKTEGGRGKLQNELKQSNGLTRECILDMLELFGKRENDEGTPRPRRVKSSLLAN